MLRMHWITPADYLTGFRNRFAMDQFRIAGSNGTAKYSAASLFCGGGMAELGFLRTERFSFVWGAESNPDLAAVWQSVNESPIYNDATKVTLGNGVDRVVFMLLTPPCTDYCPLGSRKGHRGKTGGLLLEVIRIVLQHRPKCFLLETTYYVFNIDNGYAIKRVIAELKVAYEVHEKIVQVVRQGDASNRRRLLVVGFDKKWCESKGFPRFQWPTPIFDETWWPRIQDLGVKDKDIPDFCHRSGEFTETDIQDAPMRIVRVASYGEGSGHCDMPNNVHAQWGLLHACIPSGGGGQIAFQEDGLYPSEFSFSGQSFVAPDLMYSRAANMPDDSYDYIQQFCPKDRNAHEWYRQVLNQGVPMHTSFGVAQSIFKHLQLLGVEFDYPKLTEVSKSKLTPTQFRMANASKIRDDGKERAKQAVKDRKYGLEKCCFDTGATRSVANKLVNPHLTQVCSSKFKFTLADSSEQVGDKDGIFKFWTIGADMAPCEATSSRLVSRSLPITTMSNTEQTLISGDDLWADGYSPLLQRPEVGDGVSKIYRPATKDRPAESIWCPKDLINGGWVIFTCACRGWNRDAASRMLEKAKDDHIKANSDTNLKERESRAMSLKQARQVLDNEASKILNPQMTKEVSMIQGFGEFEREFRGIYKRLNSKKKEMNAMEYHCRHGHTGYMPGCRVCWMINGAMRRIFTVLVKHTEIRPGYLWHMDMCEIAVTSSEGHKYWVTARDAMSGVFKTILMREKDDCTELIRNWITSARNDPVFQGYGYNIVQYIKLDNAGEWSEVCQVFNEMRLQVGFQTIYSNPDKEEDKGRQESSVKATARVMRSILAQQCLPPQEWHTAAVDVDDLLNLHPKADGSRWAPLDGDAPAPIELLSRFRVSRHMCAKKLSVYVMAGTPCMVNIKGHPGSNPSSKVVWKIASGLRPGWSTAQMNFFDPFTKHYSHSSSYAAVHLNRMNWAQYLNLKDYKSAFGKVIPRREKDETVRFTFDLPTNSGGEHIMPSITGVQVISDKGNYELKLPEGITDSEGFYRQSEDDDIISDTRTSTESAPPAKATVMEVDQSAQVQDREDEQLINVDEWAEQSVISVDDDESAQAWDDAEFLSIKDRKYVADGKTRWKDVYRKVGVEFEDANLYHTWIQQPVAKGYVRVLNDDVPRDAGKVVKKGTILYPPFGYRWKKLKQEHDAKALMGFAKKLTPQIEATMADARVAKVCDMIDLTISRMVAKLQTDALVRHATTQKASRVKHFARKAGRGTTKQEVSELLQSEYGHFYAAALNKEWGGLLDRHVLSLGHTRRELEKAGKWKSPVPFSVQLKDKFVPSPEGDDKSLWDAVKGRVCIMGCEHFMKQGIHYFDTYSPKPRPNTWKLFQALKVLFKLYRLAFDYTMAYTNAEKSPGEELVLKYPQSFEEWDKESGEELYILLERCLYGDPGADRAWGKCRDEFTMQRFNKDGWKCKRAVYDPCVFVITAPRDGPYSIAGTHTDDTDMLGQNEAVLQEIFGMYLVAFKVSIIDASFMLGIRRTDTIGEDGEWITTCTQEEYIQGVYDTWKAFMPTKSVDTPFPVKVILTLNDEVPEEEWRAVYNRGYPNALGHVGWAAQRCQPLSLYGYSQCAKVMSRPSEFAWKCLMHMIKWLHQNKHKGLRWSSKGGTEPEGLTSFPTGQVDASNSSDPKDGRVHMGWWVGLAGGMICAGSHKQRDVGVGTATVEYQAFKSVCSDLVWVRNMLIDLGFKKLVEKPTPVFGDNDAANTWAKYGSSSAVNITNQHIKRDYHIVKEMVDDKVVSIHRVGSPSNLADIPSKAVSKEVIAELGDAFCGYEKWAPNFKGKSNKDRTADHSEKLEY
jgi:hypothetical protein